MVSEDVKRQAQNVYRIWEITDPTNVGNVAFTDMGAQKSWRIRTDSLRQFIAFRNGGFLSPKLIGRAANQDLHALVPPLDMVIVAHPQFLNQAYTLADRRVSEGLSVLEERSRKPVQRPLAGTRATVLGGFCLVSGAILMAAEGPWVVSLILLVLGLALPLRKGH